MSESNPPWLYAPWLREHGDALIAGVAATGLVSFAPVSLFPTADPQARHQVALFSRLKPDAYRCAVRRRLLAATDRAAGLVVTFDWAPAMRILVEAAHDIGLPTVLVLHEGVFFDRNLYYGGADVVPATDHVLAWGGLHREVFVSRGYEPARISLVGSHKLVMARGYRATLSPREWRSRLGLPDEGGVVVFAVQPLDNVADPVAARAKQRSAIVEVAAAAAAAGFALVVRPPPATLPDLLPDPLPVGAVLAAPGPDLATQAHETIAQATALVSIGSTMLIEAAAMGRPALALAHYGLRSAFADFGLPSIEDGPSLRSALAAIGRGEAERFTMTRAFASAFGLTDVGALPANIIAAHLGEIAGDVDLAALREQRRRRGDAIDRFLAFERLGLPPKLRKLILRPDAFFRDLAVFRRDR